MPASASSDYCANYWQHRYRRTGKGSGKGSTGPLLAWKADRINRAVQDLGVTSVLDIGCGDGQLASRLRVPDYLGVDLAPAAVGMARRAARPKKFQKLDETVEPRDLHLSVDVMFHLVDDADYRSHLDLLFSAHRYVIVHATDFDAPGRPHVLHRHWTDDVPDGWTQIDHQHSQMSLAVLTVWERR